MTVIRSRITVIACALFCALPLALAPVALATPSSVDQYTEPKLSPGGGFGEVGEKTSEPSGPNPSEDPTVGPSSDPAADTAATDTSSTKKNAKKRKTGRAKPAGEAKVSKVQGAARTQTVRPASVASLPDEGLGWIFPTLLVGLTAGVAGFMIGRSRGSAGIR